MSFAKCSQNVRLMGLSGSRLGVVQETFFNAGWVTTEFIFGTSAIIHYPRLWSGNLVKIAHLDRPRFNSACQL